MGAMKELAMRDAEAISWGPEEPTEQMIPDICPHCGSTDILSDYFEDEWTYWCNPCGRDIMIKEKDNELREDWVEDAVSRAEGKLVTNILPRNGRGKVRRVV